MSIAPHSTTSSRPAKPYPDFPLYAHATRRWAKKIAGQTHFFGPWDDWQGALRRYLAQDADLRAGRKPARPAEEDVLTVREMVVGYLDARKLDVANGNLERRTWKEYEDYGKRMVRVFGAEAVVQNLGPADFLKLKADLVKTHKSLSSLKGDIRKCKVFFNWAGPGEKGMNLYSRPLRFGPDFQSPRPQAIKRQLDERPSRVFHRKQIYRLLAKATPAFRAMILLGINCGMGNTDCARLTREQVNLKTGWIRAPRRKTGNDRLCPLWPETLEALKAVWKKRKPPRDPAHGRHFFLTKYRRPFDPTDISHAYVKLAAKVKVRDHKFYDLRHTFCTVADNKTGLQKAIDTIMGDKPPANYMTRSVYSHGSAPKADLRAVVNAVHTWLNRASAMPASSASVTVTAARPAPAAPPRGGA